MCINIVARYGWTEDLSLPVEFSVTYPRPVTYHFWHCIQHACCILVDIVKCPFNVFCDSTTVIICISIQFFDIGLSWDTWVAESLIFQEMTERFCSSFKEFRSRFNVLIPCFCMIPSQSTGRTTSHSAGFYLSFNPWNLSTKGIKIIIIVIVISLCHHWVAAVLEEVYLMCSECWCPGENVGVQSASNQCRIIAVVWNVL